MHQYSAASVVRRWRQACSDGRTCSTVRSIPSVALCSTTGTQTQNRMKTSPRQTSPNGGGKLTYSQEGSLVSLSVTPGSDEERKTTAISGRSCTGVLTKSDPIGSFVRTLLESRRWSNKATLLRWQTQPTYSERITDYEDTDSERPLPLNASAVISRQTDMQSSRCLYRLVPLEPRTGETACSSSGEGLLPTPVVVDNPHPNSKVNEQGRRYNHKAESSHSMGLADLALHHLLPTPKELAAGGGNYSLLSPLYTQEMMGFPLGWTEHPFLSTNGGRRPSKPTATPSSRR